MPRENGNEMELTIRGGNEILRKVSFSPFFSLPCAVSLTSFPFITGIDHDARVEKLRVLRRSQDSFLFSVWNFSIMTRVIGRFAGRIECLFFSLPNLLWTIRRLLLDLYYRSFDRRSRNCFTQIYNRSFKIIYRCKDQCVY